MLCFVIDDDLDDQEIFIMALHDLGQHIECVTATDGAAALLKLEEQDFNPHYIFLDLNMPQMHGMRCLAEIKKITRLDHVPVVIYSTSSENKDIVESKRLGAAGFITKPHTVPALIDQLNEFFKSY